MNTIRRHFALPSAAAILFSLGSILHAEEQSRANPEAPSAVLIQGMQNYRESYLSQLMAPFRTATGDRPGLTANDIQKTKQIASANIRAQALIPFLSADLDGDGQLTLEEFQTSRLRFWPSTGRDQAGDAVLKQFQQMDANGDGIVTFEEARIAANHNLAEEIERRSGGDRLEQLLALDPNKDGLLTADELEQMGRQAFAYYDRDGDGMLSNDERQILSKDISLNQRMASLKEQFLRCLPQRPDGDEQFYFIDAYGVQALSTVSLAGPDTLTETAEINIEAGDKPLYVVALGRRQIVWRLTGDVKRVGHFMAVSTTPAVGVTGLPRNVVTLAPNAQCFGRVSIDAASTRVSASALEQAVGRPLRGMVYQPFSKAKLPSDATLPADITDVPLAKLGAMAIGTDVPPPPSGVDEETNASFWRYHPGGLIQIDPTQVIATGPVANYDVPPMEAGLMKLLSDGSITSIGPRAYRIEKPIAHIPAGLTGQQAVHFSLAPGVSPPKNNPPSSPGVPLSRIYVPNKF